MSKLPLVEFWIKRQQPDLLSTLLRGAGVALGVQILSVGTLYACQIFLARSMGVTEYGIYDYANALSLSLAFLAGLGLPTAVLRFISEYLAKQDWAHLQGILRGSWQQTLIASVITAILSTAILQWLAIHQGLEYLTSLTIAVWMVPLMALANLQQQIARAFRQITLAYAPYLIVYPLVLIGIASLWQLHHNLNSTVVIALSMVSMLVVLIIQSLLLFQNLSIEIRQAHPIYANGQWWRVALPLILFDGSSVVLSQTDTLMLGVMVGADAVGIYGAALKTSLWVHFILNAVNAISAPMIASLYAQGNRQGLQHLVSTIARWMFYPALAIAIALIVFAERVLQLFGTEFTKAKGVLIILILGQLVNVGAGSVGYLLVMTGHQVQSALVMGASALVNVVLNFIGIEWLGIVGAALATAFSMMLWNVWLHSLVVKRLGVHPSILSTFR
jgi:O-antigen/teichoic acid export membrane protein